MQMGSGAESKTLGETTNLSLETVQHQLQRGLEMCYMRFPEWAFHPAFQTAVGFFNLKESMLSTFAI